MPFLVGIVSFVFSVLSVIEGNYEKACYCLMLSIINLYIAERSIRS